MLPETREAPGLEDIMNLIAFWCPVPVNSHRRALDFQNRDENTDLRRVPPDDEGCV